ncbi:hypothetical protein [Methylococcus sp. EFPC2]|uniref:hypothetical protein n=1 Tax=Methylococcus sp. EFPC2 TaxID=2812648 RepID=UPI00196874E0|nr:hypothetical protein [Methylococcus sp. EFPC2]QSA98562.1 hypothetical protein JWZ97_07130 [Methylococcus sp. EFPC2]
MEVKVVKPICAIVPDSAALTGHRKTIRFFPAATGSRRGAETRLATERLTAELAKP